MVSKRQDKEMDNGIKEQVLTFFFVYVFVFSDFEKERRKVSSNVYVDCSLEEDFHNIPLLRDCFV